MALPMAKLLLQILRNFVCKILCKRRNLLLILLPVSFVWLLLDTVILYHSRGESHFRNTDVSSPCVIPDMDPFDPEAMQFFSKISPVHCSSIPNLVYVTDEGMLEFNRAVFESTKLSFNDITCFYSVIERLEDDENIRFKPEIKVAPHSYIDSDFFKVRCVARSEKVVYENIHAHIARNRTLRGRLPLPDGDDQYSVYMFGLDSVSRLAAIRYLPKTYKYITEQLEIHEFKGYMKVGEHTGDNIMPILTGKPFDAHFDDAPFLWKAFGDSGYATMHAEDWPEINPLKFHKQQVDHYMRPWWLAMKDFRIIGTTFTTVLLFFENMNIKLSKTSGLCYGNTFKHIHLINYFKSFITRYKNKRRFAFTWDCEIAHDFSNFLQLIDDDILAFFRWLADEGHLDRAVLVFLSDHGNLQEPKRNTRIGRIESRMPLMMLAMPPSFKIRYPSIHATLKQNTKRLTTNYDVHASLTDILHARFSKIERSTLKEASNKTGPISLFRPISEERSCADALIPEHHCACYKSSSISHSEPVVTYISKFAVGMINGYLNGVTDLCAKLQLSTVIQAETASTALKIKQGKSNWGSWRELLRNIWAPKPDSDTRYIVVFRTSPGNATFEATVHYKADGAMTLLDNVSRTNTYGNQSYCIEDKSLRPYCFCRSFQKHGV